MRIAVVLFALARVAAAEPPGLTPAIEPPAPKTEPSYRGQTAAADGVAIGLVLIAMNAHSEFVGELGIGTYAIGGPAIHLAHHRPGRAAGSLAMRIGLPLIGGWIGSQHDGCHGDECGNGDAIALGILTGMVAAVVVDSAWLAEGDPPPARPTWSPSVTAGRTGVSLGVAATF